MVRETGSDAGRVAMVLSPGMSAKFPRNVSLQGSIENSVQTINHEHGSAPSFVFKLMP